MLHSPSSRPSLVGLPGSLTPHCFRSACDKAFGYTRTSNRIRREFERHANFCGSVDRREAERGSFGASTDIVDQMDSKMYTLAALDARSALRHDPRVVSVLQEWWRVIQRRLHALSLVRRRAA